MRVIMISWFYKFFQMLAFFSQQSTYNKYLNYSNTIFKKYFKFLAGWRDIGGDVTLEFACFFNGALQGR